MNSFLIGCSLKTQFRMKHPCVSSAQWLDVGCSWSRVSVCGRSGLRGPESEWNVLLPRVVTLTVFTYDIKLFHFNKTRKSAFPMIPALQRKRK